MPASYCRRPFAASASARFTESEISSGSRARLSRRSLASLIALTSDGLSLLINHLARDQAVFKCCIAVSEAATLLFSLRRRWARLLGCFKQPFEVMRHGLLPYSANQCHHRAPPFTILKRLLASTIASRTRRKMRDRTGMAATARSVVELNASRSASAKACVLRYDVNVSPS